MAAMFSKVPSGAKHAETYHLLVMGAMTALFYPDLIHPHKEWEVNGGRKRIDIVFTNAGDTGFFAQRRADHMMNANTVILECKNYSSDIANAEFDQLLGRFDNNRGKFGIITCRNLDKPKLALDRCRDASSRSQGYIIILTDDDIKSMLLAKSQLKEEKIEQVLFRKLRDLLA